MFKVKIYGAGSIGNHLAHAFRELDMAVSICDTDEQALRRTRDEIYPARYGAWDDNITLASIADLSTESFDIVAVGTPPDSHIEILLRELEQGAARLMLVEKPLCGPDLAGCDELVKRAQEKDVVVCVGYNHVLTRNTVKAMDIVASGRLGTAQTMTVNWVEHWGGIFAAHPWLSGPADSYLGHAHRGGGACGEHSHGINIWQHFAHALGAGRIAKVSAVMDRVKTADVDYDRIAQLSVVSESGLTGYIVQDVVTTPPRKHLRIQGDEGVLVWDVNIDAAHDSIRYWDQQSWQDELIPKKRPDDFAAEAGHIEKLLAGAVQSSPISLERGLETMLVIAAANESARQGRSVEIDYTAGYTSGAITKISGN